MILNTRTKIISSLALSLFVVSLVSFAGLVGLISKSDRELETYKLELAKNQSYEQEFQMLSRLVDESVEERKQIESHILKEEGVIDFLALLEALGAEQGATVKTASLEVSEPTGGFEEVSLTVSVEGSYLQVVHVLKELEMLPYQSRITNIALERQSGGEELYQWRGTFKLHVTKYTKL